MKYYYTYKITLTQGSLKGKFYFGKGYTRLGENHPLYGKHRVYDNPERTKYHYE